MCKTSLKESIRNVELLKRKKKVIEKELVEVESSISEYRGRAQRAVLDGESTGNRVHDLVIRAHGLHPELFEPYTALEEKLRGKKGEFVMIKYPMKVRVRYGGDSRLGDYRHETRFRMAVLTDETLRLVPGIVLEGAQVMVIALPVESYLEGVLPGSYLHSLSLEEKTHKRKGGLFGWTASYPPALYQYLTKEEHRNDLLIGDTAVAEVLREVGGETLMNIAGERLDRLILRPTE